MPPAEQTDGDDDRFVDRVEQSTLQPSVVAVQGCESSQECWLVSSGQGDILLIKSRKGHGKDLHKTIIVQYAGSAPVQPSLGCHPSQSYHLT